MSSPAPSTLNLAQVASWQIPVPSTSSSTIIARVPSLQRGAVWKAGQVELLWDSILRGFPIGAFVVCKKLKGQKSRKGEHGRRNTSNEESVTHHLLDGQQRAAAIALGFDDPCTDNEPRCAALWLDLSPSLAENSSRSFLFRETTQAHPWGYAKGDDANVIPASRKRAALEAYGWRNAEGKLLRQGGPNPNETWPIEATAPIPLAWLIRDTDEAKLSDSKKFWADVCGRCEALLDSALERAWAKEVIQALDKNEEPACLQREAILAGLRRAVAFKIVLLEVPEDALTSITMQEAKLASRAGSEQLSKDNIANVEHLFQRLNAGGTPLGGEELAYSMIKAYWPEVEEPIECSAERRMPPSRLVRLGARVSLVDPITPSEKLPGALSVSDLRGIALSQDKTYSDKRDHILDFFIRRESQPTKLESVLRLIDAWLGDNGNITDGIGLLPVLRSSITRTSPDVSLLLMWLARRALAEGIEEHNTARLRKPILGFATALHWFGYDKARAVAALYKVLKDKRLEPPSFQGLLKTVYQLENGKIGLLHLATPEKLKSIIELPPDENRLKEWQWWKLARDENNKELPEYVALQKIKDERELLLYAQRAYLKRHFGDYDPARQDLWDQHNRPWDYDHILPSVTVYWKYNIPGGVKAWAYCIANLRAWPMEDNRSDKAVSPAHKLSEKKLCKDSFITEDELRGFEIGYEDVRDFKKVNRFITEANNRLLRIYREWYDTLGIDYLIDKP